MSIFSSYYKKAKKAYDRSDLGKAGGELVKAVTGGKPKNPIKYNPNKPFKPPPLKLKIPTKGFDQFGRRIKVKIPTSIKDTSLNNAANELTKLSKGDFSLKKAVQGTVSGASKTIKESDAGKGVKIIADKSGYTGSDFDKGLQKVEKETSNVANQTLDLVDSPAKVVNKAVNKIKNVVKPPELPKLKPLTPAPSGPTSKEGYGLTKKKKRSGELVGALTTDPVTISKRKKKFAKGKSSLRVRPSQNTLGGLKIRRSTGVGLS